MVGCGRFRVLKHWVHVVCVVNDEGRLVGILDLRSLADDLF